MIRFADIQDAGAIRQIYAPYVEETAITFEYRVPDVDEFAGRLANTLKNYPYLVAEEEGRIVGYAYAGPFRPRAAYQHSAEVSIYVDRTFSGHGIGRQLYQELEKHLRKQNVFLLYACITKTDREEDAYLTDGSIRFHTKMGYTLAGTHHLCGYKFGQWYSMVWMEKLIAVRPEHPEEFIPFSRIQESERRKGSRQE
ncbi:MAG: N-acetyltransferase [Parasporobacterium sp.]|nr:N-acetyltransferase [Parasporobacterium sp.]